MKLFNIKAKKMDYANKVFFHVAQVNRIAKFYEFADNDQRKEFELSNKIIKNHLASWLEVIENNLELIKENEKNSET